MSHFDTFHSDVNIFEDSSGGGWYFSIKRHSYDIGTSIGRIIKEDFGSYEDREKCLAALNNELEKRCRVLNVIEINTLNWDAKRDGVGQWANHEKYMSSPDRLKPRYATEMHA